MKVGIIGFGRIGKIHFSNIKNIPIVTERSICDPKAHDLDNSVRQFADWKNLIDSTEPDAIIICSPTPTHFDIIKYCCKKKIHVFCEKPVDLDLEKIETLQEITKVSKIICQVGFNRRFDPDFSFIKNRLENRDIGQIQQITITSRDPGLPSMAYIASSGGMMMDMTIHDFDMFRYLSNEEAEKVYTSAAVLVDPALKKYNDIDTATTMITTVSGLTCTINNSRSAAYGYDQRLEIFGSKGMLSVDNNTEHRTKIWSSDGKSSSKPLNFFLERYAQSYKLELESFFDCIKHNKDATVTIDDALKATKIAQMAMDSIKSGQVVYS